MLCQDGDDGPGYVKFGRTTDPHNRLTTLRMTCPIPARYFAVCGVPTHKRHVIAEKELHKRFKHRAMRKGRGEWFRFDFSCDEDKRDFNDGCREVFFRHLPKGSWWTKISVAAIDQYNDERRLAYLKSKHRAKIDRKYRALRAQSKAWNELAR